MKQFLLVPFTENGPMAREYLMDLERKAEEEMTWRVELDHMETCQDLLKTVEGFKKGSRKEMATRMKYAFKLSNGMKVVEVAGYVHDVARRQSQEKKKAAELRVDIEMRQVEICVRGTKRKAFRKETAEEKGDKGRAAKKKMIWLAWSRKTKSNADVIKKAKKRTPVKNRVKETKKFS